MSGCFTCGKDVGEHVTFCDSVCRDLCPPGILRTLGRWRWGMEIHDGHGDPALTSALHDLAEMLIGEFDVGPPRRTSVGARFSVVSSEIGAGALALRVATPDGRTSDLAAKAAISSLLHTVGAMPGDQVSVHLHRDRPSDPTDDQWPA